MIDVLIPTLQANADLLPDCIESLTETADFPLRIVVVLDAVCSRFPFPEAGVEVGRPLGVGQRLHHHGGRHIDHERDLGNR